VAVTIDLDDQLVLEAAKVDDELADRMLAPELDPAELLAPQPGPELLLDRRLVATQFPGPIPSDRGIVPAVS
jgi:hypothetical protein